MRNYQMVLWQMYQAKKRTSSLLHFYDSLSQVVNSMYFIWTIAAVNLKGICRDLTITVDQSWWRGYKLGACLPLNHTPISIFGEGSDESQVAPKG